MKRTTARHPDQLRLGWADDARIEREVEERIVRRLEAESFRWRFRLVAIETLLMALLILVSGLLLKQPTGMVVRASLLVGGSCFATGTLLLGMSAGTARLLTRARRWWRS
jgi:hypothetical protein